MAGTNLFSPLTSTVDVALTDASGNAVLVRCATANIPSAVAGYAVGCILQNITTGHIYQNEGTASSCSFTDVSAISTAEIADGAVTSPKISSDVIQVATHNLTAAEIIGMSVTPVSLVPAVAGKTIVVDDICLKMTTTATAFTGGSAVELRYTDGSGAKVSADIAAAVITAGAGTSYTINKSIVTSLTGVVNSPIVMTNATTPFADGTGTGVVTVRYHLI